MPITHRFPPPHRSPHLSEGETSNFYPTRTLTPNHGPGCVLVVFYKDQRIAYIQTGRKSPARTLNPLLPRSELVDYNLHLAMATTTLVPSRS